MLLKTSDHQIMNVLKLYDKSPISQQLIATRSRYTQRTVRSSVNRLERIGLVEVDRSRRPFTYRLKDIKR